MFGYGYEHRVEQQSLAGEVSIMKADACSKSCPFRVAVAVKSAARRSAMVLAAMLLIIAGSSSTSEAGESKSTWYADLNLPGFAGKALTAAELRGRPVLVQFWASWCSSCSSLLWDLDELTRGFSDVVYAVVSVDDDADAPRAYLEQHALFERHPQRFYFDASATLKRSLAVEAVPLIVLFDASGRELHRHAGHVNSADLQRIRNLLAHQPMFGVTDEAK